MVVFLFAGWVFRFTAPKRFVGKKNFTLNALFHTTLLLGAVKLKTQPAKKNEQLISINL